MSASLSRPRPYHAVSNDHVSPAGTSVVFVRVSPRTYRRRCRSFRRPAYRKRYAPCCFYLPRHEGLVLADLHVAGGEFEALDVVVWRIAGHSPFQFEVRDVTLGERVDSYRPRLAGAETLEVFRVVREIVTGGVVLLRGQFTRPRVSAADWRRWCRTTATIRKTRSDWSSWSPTASTTGSSSSTSRTAPHC